MSHAADNDDAVLFIRGVQRFSVAEGRPHWPGYPVYVGVGKVASFLVGDAALGLQIVSAAACAAMVWPVISIVGAWARTLGATPREAARAGVCAAVLWLVTPMSWVTGSQIVSDPLGLFVGLVMVALCIHGETTGAAGPWVAAAVLGGAMTGVRLVNVTMFTPLIWKAWSSRRERWWRLPPALAIAAAIVAGAAPWLAWLALRDASGYVKAGEQHLSGHFTRFGESIWTDPHPMGRPWIALRTLAVYGLGAGGPEQGGLRFLTSAGWIALLALASTLRPWRGRVALVLGLWAIPHLAYVFLGHDVAYARYHLTAALTIAMGAGLAAATTRRTALAAIAITTVSTAAVSLPLAVHQGRRPPVEYQAARYLARQPTGSMVVATRSESLLGVYAMLFGDRVAVRDAGQDVALVSREAYEEGRQLYATGVPPDSSSWAPVAHFCRDPMIEPLMASEIWLFRLGVADPDRPLPACGEER